MSGDNVTVDISNRDLSDNSLRDSEIASFKNEDISISQGQLAAGGTDRFKALRTRVKAFALRVINVYSSLPTSGVGRVIGLQLLRSGTSVGAQYVEGHRAKSPADFVSKIEGAMQELEESLYWLELLVDAEVITKEKLEPLIDETDQLLAIFVSIVKTSKLKQARSSKRTKE